MEFELKSLSAGAVPRALAKAERYRLLNEPGEAESICLDALAIEPDNQEVLAMLLLALTDQFDDDTSCLADSCIAEALATAGRLRDDYERAYFTGIVYERRAKAQLRHGSPGAGPRAFEWLRIAMRRYEEAEAIRPSGNDDAVLRWNACARLIMRDHHLVPILEERSDLLLLE
jgi:hypothetical protein